MQELRLTEFEWDADSTEMLLPLAYPSVGILAGSKEKKNVIEGILEGHLTSGPQYLKFHPAQELYLDFIRDMFRTIAESFSPTQSERTSIYVWWLRFERLLASLNQNKDDHKRKKLKSMVKDFLKRDVNRNNIHLYREYALIEREIGHIDSCVNILETAIGMQTEFLASVSNRYEKGALCSIFRALFETLLDEKTYQEDHRSRILKAAARMVSGPDENRLEQAEEFMETSVNDFLNESPLDPDENSYFLPYFECDIITCYAYYLYTKNSTISDSITLLENCLEHSKDNKYLQVIKLAKGYPIPLAINHKQITFIRFQETLYESTIALLHLDRKELKSLIILKEKLAQALNLYPTNCYMLSVDMEIEVRNKKKRFNLLVFLLMCVSFFLS